MPVTLSSSTALTVRSNMVYGAGGIQYRSHPVQRPLRLDIYESIFAGNALRPALLLAHGGSFHVGTKEDDSFEEGGHRNTPVAEYCRRFAERGYVCMSMEYRLTQEDPDPGTTRVVNSQGIDRDRIDTVRSGLGLPRSTPEMIGNAVEAATDDMSLAVAWVHRYASELRINPDCFAIGGFSAGANIALLAACGQSAPVTAVVALSGVVEGSLLARRIAATGSAPAMFLARGQDDVPHIEAQQRRLADHLVEAGVAHESWSIPGGTHFYKRDAMASSTQGVNAPLEAAMASFLNFHLKHTPV